MLDSYEIWAGICFLIGIILLIFPEGELESCITNIIGLLLVIAGVVILNCGDYFSYIPLNESLWKVTTEQYGVSLNDGEHFFQVKNFKDVKMLQDSADFVVEINKEVFGDDLYKIKFK